MPLLHALVDSCHLLSCARFLAGGAPRLPASRAPFPTGACRRLRGSKSGAAPRAGTATQAPPPCLIQLLFAHDDTTGLRRMLSVRLLWDIDARAAICVAHFAVRSNLGLDAPP